MAGCLDFSLFLFKNFFLWYKTHFKTNQDEG
jgi:hypothetical protein